jgi:hypothetical protein
MGSSVAQSTAHSGVEAMSKKILAAVVLSVLTPLAMAAKPITSNSNGEYTEYPLEVQRMQSSSMQTAQGSATNIRVQDVNHVDSTRSATPSNRDISMTWRHNSSENGEWTTYPAPGY